MARNKAKEKDRKYMEEKLIKIPFFSRLTFTEFKKICDVATINTIGPNEVLL